MTTLPNPDTLKSALVASGLRCEVFSSPDGRNLLARILGERQGYSTADRIVCEHGAQWVSDVETPDRIAELGYPRRER